MAIKNEKHPSLELYREQIENWYRSHGVIREKSELYHDFLVSLFDLINETYLGLDILRSEDDMLGHYVWCFNKVTDDFEKERIYFISKNTHQEYLWYFFHKVYYACDKEDKYGIILEYFKFLFNFTTVKSVTDLESFYEIYKIFDQNLKKTN